MNQNKYRQKLQDRNINPSSGAWEQLETVLDSHEKKKKRNPWIVLKAVSVVLIFISIGYYVSGEKETDPIQNIAFPSEQENVENTTEETHENSSPITTSNSIPTFRQESMDNANKGNLNQQYVKNEKSTDHVEIKNNLFEVSLNDSIVGIVEVAKLPKSEEQLLDDEVEQLLRKSQIKLVVNGRISSPKVVSSEALLNSVQEDLYKDLKQKLIEKLAKKLKNPKDVVVSSQKN